MRVVNKIDLASGARCRPLRADGRIACRPRPARGWPNSSIARRKPPRRRLPAASLPAITRARHRAELEAAAQAPCSASARSGGGPEIKAEELRIAARHLGRLTGRIDVEEVLGAIFVRVLHRQVTQSWFERGAHPSALKVRAIARPILIHVKQSPAL